MPLYAFGSNSSYQLSLPHDEDVAIPTECCFSGPPPIYPPSAIIAGGNHTLLIFPSGVVYAAGSNSAGQCGLNKETRIVKSFTALPQPPQYSQSPEGRDSSSSKGWALCAAGWEFTILVTNDGRRVYSLGLGSRGELGMGPAIVATTSTELLYLIPDFPPPETRIVDLTSSITHVVAVLSDGTAYGWGVARKGQISTPGTSQPPKAIYSPTLIPTSFPVAKASCTGDSTLLISESGDRHELLGLIQTSKSMKSDPWGLRKDTPSCGELTGYASVHSTWSGYYVHMKDGTVKCWGRGDRGQILPADSKLQGRIRSIAAGSEHVVAEVVVDAKGEETYLTSWGWSEHGNCGSVADIVPSEEYQVLTPFPKGAEAANNKIRCVGAGCATSWVWVDWDVKR